MEAREVARDRKANARSRDTVRELVGDAVKRLEDAVTFARRYTGTVVRDGNFHCVADPAARYIHFVRVPRIFLDVVEQVADDLFEDVVIEFGRIVGLSLEVYRNAGLRERGLEVFDRLA